MSSETPLDLDALRAQVTKQAGLVRSLKAEGAGQEAIMKAVADLQVLRDQLEKQSEGEDQGCTYIRNH